MKQRNSCDYSSLWFASTIKIHLTINDMNIASDMGYACKIEMCKIASLNLLFTLGLPVS